MFAKSNVSGQGTCKSNSSDVSGSALIDYLTDPCRYDKWSRPSNNSDPTKVAVRILVYFLGSIEAQNLQFTVQILVSYRWTDPRLNHTGEIIEGEGTLRDKLWTPHLYLVNEHDSKVMGSGQADVLVSIDTDGTVSYTTRLKATLLCLMNLKKFPFDNQKCPLVLESWGYNTSQLILEWEKDSPVSIKSETQLTEYSLVNVWTNTSVTDYSVGNINEDIRGQQHYQSKFAGNYSCVIVQFLLEREVGHYIMDYYVPSIFLVVVSWVSFWLDPNAVPGRTTLGTSTMLTFITLSRNIGSSLPKVSYVKATEIWFIICTAFIFASLVEFAFVNTIWRRRKNVELKKVSSKYILKSTLTPQQKRRELSSIDRSQSFSSLDESKLSSSGLSKKYNSQLTVTSVDSISKNPFAFNSLSDESLNISVPVPEATPTNKGWFTMTPQEIAQWIDKRSRIVFPVAFIIFNLLYWIFVWF